MSKAERRLNMIRKQLQKTPQEVLICSAVRTPITKAKKGLLKDVPIEEMLAQLYKHIITSTKLDPSKIEEIAIGNLLKIGANGYFLKFTQYLAGFPETVPCYAVNRMGAAGTQAVSDIANSIRCGEIDIGIGGGAESLSMFEMELGYHLPYPSNRLSWENFLNYFMPMGQISDNIALNFSISREKIDKMAFISNQKAHKAQINNLFEEEIVPIKYKGKLIKKDDSIRHKTTIESLSKLKPSFLENGLTTSGNSSQKSDGAAILLLASRKAVESYSLPVLARWIGCSAVGVPPEIMGVGPAYAIPKVLKKVGLSIEDIDLFEINEAFASQAVYCVEKLGIDMNKVNVKGGSIAIGHPFGATGARLLVTLIPELKRRKARYGVVSMCIGSGMGLAAVVENLNKWSTYNATNQNVGKFWAKGRFWLVADTFSAISTGKSGFRTTQLVESVLKK